MTPRSRFWEQHRGIALLVAFCTALRLGVAPTFGLGVDEAHYVLYGLHLDWSYFDHPPLVGWVHALFLHTLGTGELVARLPAVLLFAVTSVLCYRFVLCLSDRRTALLATLALNASFLFGALGLMLLPESLLLPLTFGVISTVRRIEAQPRAGGFVCLGFLLGLAGLAKYTAVLFVPALLLHALLGGRRDLLRDPRLLLTAAVAALLVSPVFFWNWVHGFASFRFQADHVLGGHSFAPARFATTLAAQFGAYSPPLFCLAFYGLYRAVKSDDSTLRLSALMGGIPLVFFLASSLGKRGLPHWSAVFYLLFIPIGVAFLQRNVTPLRRRILAFSLAFSVVLSLLAHVELGAKLFRFPDYHSPFTDIYGFPALLKRANELLEADTAGRKAIAVAHWTDASRAAYYNLPYSSEVFLVDRRDNQFALWQTSPVGYDLLFLNSHLHAEDIGDHFVCRRVERAGNLTLELRGGKVDTVEFVWCRGFAGLKP